MCFYAFLQQFCSNPLMGRLAETGGGGQGGGGDIVPVQWALDQDWLKFLFFFIMHSPPDYFLRVMYKFLIMHYFTIKYFYQAIKKEFFSIEQYKSFIKIIVIFSILSEEIRSFLISIWSWHLQARTHNSSEEARSSCCPISPIPEVHLSKPLTCGWMKVQYKGHINQ